MKHATMQAEFDRLQEGQELLDAFMKVAPFLNRLVREDITIEIYDTEKLLLNVPGKRFSLNVEKGDPLNEGGVIAEAIRNDRDAAASLPAELFGVPLIAKAIPVHDEEGRVIGGIGIGTSAEKYDSLFQISSNLSTVVEQVTATVQEMAKSVTELVNNINHVLEQAENASNSLNEIEKIASTVGEIADHSNLLGLNAAIESARAGEHGKGFAVVADEVRKLATTSKSHAVSINNTTDKIRNLIQNLNDSISQVNSQSENQSAAIQQIAATMLEISSSIETLTAMAEATLKAD